MNTHIDLAALEELTEQSSFWNVEVLFSGKIVTSNSLLNTHIITHLKFSVLTSS